MSSSSKKHRPGSAQIRTVREGEDTEQGPPSVAGNSSCCSFFATCNKELTFRTLVVACEQSAILNLLRCVRLSEKVGTQM
jgi:hypothetical protein